jgi:hypothetical protein
MDNEEQGLHVRTEIFRSLMTAAHTAVRTALIINGGAAVATLAFVGSLVQHGASVFWLGPALGCFAGGVLCAGLAAGFTYFNLCKYYEANCPAPETSIEKIAKRVNFWRWMTILLCIFSHLMFVVGCGFGVYELINLN